MSFTLHVGDHNLPLHVHGYGEENVYNALAALAAAHSIGMRITDAGEGLSTFKQVRQHLELRRGPRNSLIIDDTWNCTPPSVTASLKVLGFLGQGKAQSSSPWVHATVRGKWKARVLQNS